MRVSVIGAGSWGTALAQQAALCGHEVSLWARRASVADGINSEHRNPDYLSDVSLSSAVCATTSLQHALDGAQAVVVVVPSKVARDTAMRLADAGLSSDVPILLCSKGIELETGMGSVQLFAEVLGSEKRLACLSGPNHAEEVALGVPAATVIASESPETAALFQTLIGSNGFRAYTSDDVVGTELCGAAKNVIAIAVGISYGLGLGDNTAAMLMTRGQAEMSRLVEACGGSPLTCMGLAGTGDLIATCMSQHSRNRTFGEAVAKGESLESYEARRHMVVEGAQACRSLLALAHRQNVELPIAQAVNEVVWEGVNPLLAAEELTKRSFKPEFY